MAKFTVETHQDQTLRIDPWDLAFAIVNDFDDFEIRSFFNTFIEQIDSQNKERVLHEFFKHETNAARMQAFIERKIW